MVISCSAMAWYNFAIRIGVKGDNIIDIFDEKEQNDSKNKQKLHYNRSINKILGSVHITQSASELETVCKNKSESVECVTYTR